MPNTYGLCKITLFATMCGFAALTTSGQNVPEIPRVPEAPRVDPVPQVQSIPRGIETKTIEPQRLPESARAAETPQVQYTNPNRTPTITTTPNAAGAGNPPDSRAETPDCTVRQVSCAKSCDPLPYQWSSFQSCIRSYCERTEESCVEKIAKEFERQRDTRDSRIIFNMKVDYEHEIAIAFYSQDRNLAWPGGGQEYNINDNQTHSYALKCRTGEKICYGAWDTNRSLYWGVGPHDHYGCKNCCAVCNDSSALYTLH